MVHHRWGSEGVIRTKGARLYWDKKRKTWCIRDGTFGKRTGCGFTERANAETQLADYIAERKKPEPEADPLLASVMRDYLSHKPQEKRTIKMLTLFWAAHRTSAINPRLCNEYALSRPAPSCRRELTTLRAAVNRWHKFVHELKRVPIFVLPPPNPGRQRVLTRNEVARLLWAARSVKHIVGKQRVRHLARFIIFGFYSGTRSGALFSTEWSWINFDFDVIARKAPGEAEHGNKRRPSHRGDKRLMVHLRRWKRLDGDDIKYVIHYRGERVSEVRHGWDAACERAGIKDATPHVLRHTRISHLLMSGMSPWMVGQLVGATAEQIEETYGHFIPGWGGGAAA